MGVEGGGGLAGAAGEGEGAGAVVCFGAGVEGGGFALARSCNSASHLRIQVRNEELLEPSMTCPFSKHSFASAYRSNENNPILKKRKKKKAKKNSVSRSARSLSGNSPFFHESIEVVGLEFQRLVSILNRL
jgi:hypothetical protein